MISETSIIRNLLYDTHEVEDLSPTQANHTMVQLPIGSDTNYKYSNATTTLKEIQFVRETTSIVSGSTLQSVPSATNLLLMPQTQELLDYNCDETSYGLAFRDKRNEFNNFFDSNYVLHVLGGGTCRTNSFGNFPRYINKNTIVTAYYEIPSKHPPAKYHQWMTNLLSVYQDPMVIFTSPNLVELLTKLRYHNNTRPCDEPCSLSSRYFDTIIVSLPLEELPLAKLYSKSFWIDQLDRDPQSAIHSPLRGDPRMKGKFESGELYWIWLSKVWFVTEATRILGANIPPQDPLNSSCSSEDLVKSGIANNISTYNCNVFAWIDIGSFRNEDPTATNQDPFPLLLRHSEVVPATEMLFWSHASAHASAHSSHSPNSTTMTESAKDYSPIPSKESPYFDDKLHKGGRHFFHSGAHFAGRPMSISRFYHRFLNTIDIFVERNLTLADDQAVMQSTCLGYYASHDDGDNDDDRTEDGCKKELQNLCAYATRNMVGGKSKWFGLAKILQSGWEDISDSRNSYWKPPPPAYYREYEKRSIGPPLNSNPIRCAE